MIAAKPTRTAVQRKTTEQRLHAYRQRVKFNFLQPQSAVMPAPLYRDQRTRSTK